MAKVDLGNIVLGIFFVLAMYLGPGVIFGHAISHDFPFGYRASDAFQHQVRADAIKDAGNFKYEADYISLGIENVEGRYPPVLYHISVTLSNASGLEVYDSIFYVVLFFSVLAIVMIYLLIKEFNSSVALLSLPFTILIFSAPASTGFLWGHWPSILSQVFLLSLFWCVLNINQKRSYLFIGIVMCSLILTHTSEAIFAVFFILVYLASRFLAKKNILSDFKKFVMAAVVTFIISFYYLVIFMYTWRHQGYQFAVQPVWEGNPGFYIFGFGVVLIFIVIGILATLSRLNNLHVVLVAALAMFVGSYGNYIGFELRSFQLRFFWPIYLALFFGLGVYLLVKMIKKPTPIFLIGLVIVETILFSGLISLPSFKQTSVQNIPFVPQLNHETSAGMMNQYHWAVLNWIERNTDPDAVVYFFYGDLYNQDALLRNTKRNHVQVDNDDYIQSIQNREIKRSYVSEIPGDSGGNMVVRHSFFEFESILTTLGRDFYFGERDICEYDYIVLDRVSGQQAFAQYNQLIAQELLNSNRSNVVFTNEVAIIIKNQVGEDCIETKTF